LSYLHVLTVFGQCKVRSLYLKAISVCVCMCVQTVVQPPWLEECTMTILSDEMLFNVLKQILNY